MVYGRLSLWKFHKNLFCVVPLVCFGFFWLLFYKKMLDLQVYVVQGKSIFLQKIWKFFKFFFRICELLQIRYPPCSTIQTKFCLFQFDT